MFRRPGSSRSSWLRINPRGRLASRCNAPQSADTRDDRNQGEAVAGQFFPIDLYDALIELTSAGWRITYRDAQSARLTCGWRGLAVIAVPEGVAWWPVASQRTQILMFAGSALLAACALSV